ncbi:hypothetical protein [Variovorax sp. OV329]|uniref:hypothetical protein n=1 Tax=Variovorax sp. OV329 TaxID=1882825 RepID=UPI000B804817|nr:hypothetical protein [Variovorax sp. OV329]
MLTTAALCGLLAACAISTPGSQAPAKGQQDCVSAAARRFQQPPDSFVVESSGVTTAAEIYEVRLRNTSTGRLSKCTVDQNGTVTGVIELR